MGRRGELREVELLDPVTGQPDPPPDRTRTRHRLWLVGGVAVVAVALGVTQWVVNAREDAAVERLAQVPGVLAPVDEALEVVRTLTPEDLASLTGEAYGVLLRGEDGAQSYQWFEPADEGPGWATPLLAAPVGLADASQVYFDTTCVTDEPSGTGAGDADHVVCLVTDSGYVMSTTGQSGGALPTTTTDIVVLDTVDGSVLARWPSDGGTSIAALPEGVVVVGLVGDASDEPLAVTAYDILTGERRWTHEEPWTPGPAGIGVFRAGDLLAFSAQDGKLTFLSPDGDVVRDGVRLFMQGRALSPLSWGWRTDPRNGALVLIGQAPDGTPRSTFLAANGDPAADVVVRGEVVELGVDDGSVSGLLLSRDTSSLYAYDARTGARRWTADLRSTTTALVLRGRVYATTAREVVALDGRSGRVLWRSDELVGLTPSALLTDGAHILAAAERTGSSSVAALIAFDPADGTEVFRAPYPDGVIEVEAIGRALVGRDAASHEQVELG
ncbi:PQQ-binding-like beta-propeller repeat protein [Cellulomonas sp.]|uniref:outer membrane protein assembly factor BamB family protein n=1 Tax=Cellulomonas sp. TaxID=40001 RepID=UPI003BA9A05B